MSVDRKQQIVTKSRSVLYILCPRNYFCCRFFCHREFFINKYWTENESRILVAYNLPRHLPGVQETGFGSSRNRENSSGEHMVYSSKAISQDPLLTVA